MLILALAGCGQPSSRQDIPFAPPDAASLRHKGPIEHVVVIVQENRTVDDLFQFLPRARTQSWGLDSANRRVPLQPESLTVPYDIKHNHRVAWETEYNNGAMNGFNLDPSHCTNPGHCPSSYLRAYGYVPQSEVKPYYAMAEAYTFADEMFQTNQGPSFPAHQYLVSGTSTTYDGSPFRASENTGKRLGGCDSPPGTDVPVIDDEGKEHHSVFPCFDRRSIFTLLDDAGISWEYYQAFTGAHTFNAVDALKPIWNKKREYRANVIVPPSEVLKHINNRHLASVVYVTPTAAASDHPGRTDGSGPSWVASVVNAIGESPYWHNTAIIVTWDDWGGWYDHVKPSVRDSYELGFRVPMIVISPYAKRGYVSHVPYEFGSILKFIEETFALGSLGTTDAAANDLSDCFDFSAAPKAFEPIAAKYDASYFLRQPVDSSTPDDD